MEKVWHTWSSFRTSRTPGTARENCIAQITPCPSERTRDGGQVAQQLVRGLCGHQTPEDVFGEA